MKGVIGQFQKTLLFMTLHTVIIENRMENARGLLIIANNEFIQILVRQNRRANHARDALFPVTGDAPHVAHALMPSAQRLHRVLHARAVIEIILMVL